MYRKVRLSTRFVRAQRNPLRVPSISDSLCLQYTGQALLPEVGAVLAGLPFFSRVRGSRDLSCAHMLTGIGAKIWLSLWLTPACIVPTSLKCIVPTTLAWRARPLLNANFRRLSLDNKSPN